MSCFPAWFLPCAGASPPSVSSPSASFPLGFCTLDGCVSMSVQSAGLLLGLGWWGPSFVTWFSPMFLLFLGACGLRSLPSCWLPWGFSGHWVSVLQLTWWRGLGLQPFPSFSGLLLLCLLAGVVEVLHPVSGCSSCGGVCLVCR